MGFWRETDMGVWRDVLLMRREERTTESGFGSIAREARGTQRSMFWLFGLESEYRDFFQSQRMLCFGQRRDEATTGLFRSGLPARGQ